MLAKKYRLPVQDMRKRTGQTIRSRYFLLKIFSPAGAYSRVGVVISRKVAAKATARNRIKRSVFDWFQKNLPRLPVGDYLVILSPAVASLKKEEIHQQFENYVRNF